MKWRVIVTDNYASEIEILMSTATTILTRTNTLFIFVLSVLLVAAFVEVRRGSDFFFFLSFSRPTCVMCLKSAWKLHVLCLHNVAGHLRVKVQGF